MFLKSKSSDSGQQAGKRKGLFPSVPYRSLFEGTDGVDQKILSLLGMLPCQATLFSEDGDCVLSSIPNEDDLLYTRHVYVKWKEAEPYDGRMAYIRWYDLDDGNTLCVESDRVEACYLPQEILSVLSFFYGAYRNSVKLFDIGDREPVTGLLDRSRMQAKKGDVLACFAYCTYQEDMEKGGISAADTCLCAMAAKLQKVYGGHVYSDGRMFLVLFCDTELREAYMQAESICKDSNGRFRAFCMEYEDTKTLADIREEVRGCAPGCAGLKTVTRSGYPTVTVTEEGEEKTYEGIEALLYNSGAIH